MFGVAIPAEVHGPSPSPGGDEEVLGTALFDVADSTVAFRHQQYAKFLAAEYMTGRPVTRGQLPVLLGMADDGTIPGSLAGIAAWIGALDPELAEALPRANALVLVKTGVEFSSHAYRAAVVDGILASAASGDADPLPVQDLTALAHAGLEAQLKGPPRPRRQPAAAPGMSGWPCWPVDIRADGPGAIGEGAFTIAVCGAGRTAMAASGRFMHLLADGERERLAGLYAGLPVVTRGALAA